jgi:hypothetical protein
LREYVRVSAASGVVASTTVPAKTVTSNPAVERLTSSSVAISGRRPVGRNSLVTETKMAPARVSSPIHGNAGDADVEVFGGVDTGVAYRVGFGVRAGSAGAGWRYSLFDARRMMSLQTHIVCLMQEHEKGRVELIRPGHPERVDDIPWRELLSPCNERMLSPPRENEVAVQPVPPRLEGREAHTCVKCNPGLLGEDLERPEFLDDSVEALPD